MDVKLPQLAEGVEGGTVVNILVAEGQEVKKDQAIMELETQKAVGSIPSPSSGIVTKIHVKQGMEVSVGQLLISIEGAGGAQSTAAAKPSQAPASSAAPAPATDASAPRTATPTVAAGKTAEDYRYESKSGAPPPAPPSIRKIAREIGLDLTRVRGSEAGGRINLGDVRAYIQRLQDISGQGPSPSGGAHSAPAPITTSSESVDFSKWGPVRREKLSPLRRTVSRRMLESWTSIPKINQFWDADIICSARAAQKARGQLTRKRARI